MRCRVELVGGPLCGDVRTMEDPPVLLELRYAPQGFTAQTHAYRREADGRANPLRYVYEGEAV